MALGTLENKYPCFSNEKSMFVGLADLDFSQQIFLLKLSTRMILIFKLHWSGLHPRMIFTADSNTIDNTIGLHLNTHLLLHSDLKHGHIQL